MNRRILLIDSDTGFHDALARLLGPYRLSVAAEAEPELALSMASAGAFDAVVIAVEEPEKLGFKTFQKARKAVKAPIVLVTASVSPEAFAKHRGLKSHADGYIDKRNGDAEILQTLDGLLGLGQPDAEAVDVDVPVGDDIPMEIGDGDVVLDEEQVDDDMHGGFDNNMATVNPNSGVLVDKMVAAETDAAFDALLGDDMFGGGGDVPQEPEPAAAPVEVAAEAAPQPVEEEVSGVVADDSGIPEPVPHKIPDPDPVEAAPIDNSDFDMDSVPAAIDDGGLKSGPYSNPELAIPVLGGEVPVIEEAPVEAADDAGHDGDGATVLGATEGDGATVLGVTAEPDGATVIGAAGQTDDANNDFEDESPPTMGARDSLASIPIADDDLVALDDEMPVEVDAEEVEAVDEEPAPAPAPVAAVPQPLAAMPAAAPAEAPAAATRTKAPSVAPPAVDLGLDDIAENAEREQSGVHDRKSLRQIGELERQVAQLKTELERAKAAAADSTKAAGGSRESQFLNLRESNLAKEKELKALKASTDQQAQDLAEAQEKLRQALHAKGALEAKNSELEDRIFNSKEKELTASLNEASAKLGSVERELEAKTKAAMAAEAALAQLERDLATERANRAASASEAERTLRVEREQLIARHKGELAALKAESETTSEQALARLREELDAAHAATLEAALAEARHSAAADHGEALEATTNKHNSELVTLKSEHAGELSRTKNELSSKISELEAALAEARGSHVAAIAAAEQAQSQGIEQLRREHAQALEQAQQRFEAEIGAREEELEDARAQEAAAHAKALADLTAQLDAAKAERDRTAKELEKAGADTRAEREGHAQAREQAASEARAQREADAEAHEKALADLRAQHEAALAAAKRETESHVQGLVGKHENTVNELAKQHESALAAAKRETEEARAQAESHVQGLVGQHANAVGEIRQQHEEALGGLKQQHETALAEAKRELEAARAQAESHVVGLVGQHESAIGDLKKQYEEQLAQQADAARQAAESHKAALSAQQQQYETQLAEITENARRELTEQRGQLSAANKAAQEATARAQAEREEMQQAHASQIGELEAKHERAMAVANGEHLKASAVADAEHGKQIAALRAEADGKLQQLQEEHARVIAELGSERDELRKGLSGARDSLKRTEGELASAVQTIADRNADLRAHAAAIAERDQRITELRAEIESLEQENASYQEQVLRAYQKIKTDEAMVARARKAMAIALTVLDDQGNPQGNPTS